MIPNWESLAIKGEVATIIYMLPGLPTRCLTSLEKSWLHRKVSDESLGWEEKQVSFIV